MYRLGSSWFTGQFYLRICFLYQPFKKCSSCCLICFRIAYHKKLFYFHRMRPGKILSLLIICFLTAGNSASVPAITTANVYIIKKSVVSFHSNAKTELIKASSGELKGIIDADKRTFAFSVAIKSFAGFNSPLQEEHFNENYMESDKYPAASFTGHIIEEDDFTKDGTYNIRAKGKLNIHGVEQERILQGDLIVKGGSIKLSSIFTVLLAEHDIKIPRIVHEKLASEIKVIIDAEFVKK